VWFGILGPVEVRSAGGDVVAVGGPRPRSLLTMLLLDVGQIVGTDRLIDGLYVDTPGDAANALQSQVSRLRSRLGGLIEGHPAGYRLAVDPDQVDAHRFELLADRGRRSLASGDHAEAASLLTEALELWRGPALADVLDAPFAAAAVARLAELRLAAVEDLTDARLALGEHPVAESRALVAAHPLRERARGQLMRSLYGAGQQAEALTVFEEGRRLLADELGADPSPELAGVHLAVLRGQTILTRGLPAQLTSFVGRAADLARVADLLDTARLITVLGPGGVGKTRLAIEVAARLDLEVSFVDLVATSDVPRALMNALGLRESGLLPSSGDAPDGIDRLVAALRGRPLVVVLDNCEHVIAAAAEVASRLLADCPQLRILATSREPLGITGESLHPLSVLEIEPAVRLFTDRALAVRPGFAPTDAVARICAALDGLPLAIELAAARLRTLTVDEIESRLDDRFRLLSKGSRAAPSRHQTLSAVVEWSWDALSADEQRLASRLSVFAGGATVSSAADVCGMPADRVEDLLADLVDKSLIEVDAGRYRMLETIRAFCASRLDNPSGYAKAHAEYFLSLARQADPHLRLAEQLTWLATLLAEHGNFQAALHWAVLADTSLALELVSALSWYWYLRGMRGEIAPLALDMLDRIDPVDEEFVLCVLWAGGPPSHVDHAKTVMRTIPGPPRQPFLMVGWALFAGPPEEPDLTAPLSESFRASTDPWVRGLLGFGAAFSRWYGGGDVTEAEAECRAALDLFRTTGDRWGIAQSLDALATFADDRDQVARALELTEEALSVVAQIGAAEELAELRCRRADRLLRAHDLDQARTDYERAAALAGRAGMPATLALAHSGLGEVARHLGNLALARRWQEQALAESTIDWSNSGARAQILTALGRVAEAEGNPELARAHYQEAVDLAVDNRMPATVTAAITALTRLP
jgi:predicted ATPase/DNA-binding SARP family transcriptional activator